MYVIPRAIKLRVIALKEHQNLADLFDGSMHDYERIDSINPLEIAE